MIRSCLQGARGVYSPWDRAGIADAAKRAKSVRQTGAPLPGRLFGAFPLSVAPPITFVKARPVDGFTRLSVLFGITGGALGFLGGSALQFSNLKEIIAKECRLPLADLSYWRFISEPSLSKDYSSVTVGGLVGLFIGVGVATVLSDMIPQPKSR